MSNFSSEELLSLVKLTLMDVEGVHYHYDPETQFYNHCHDEDGKFCETETKRGIVKGETNLRDSDGKTEKQTVPSKRGPYGGSLVDPHEGTDTFDGLRGYDKTTGKPVPGTDAWLEAHGLSKEIFENRPYVRFEPDKNDPALHEAFERGTKGAAQWDRLAEQEGQEGGYIMYKHPIPDSPYGPIKPQVRPNQGAVTNYAKRTRAEVRLKNAKQRYKDLKTKITPADLVKEQAAKVKKAEINLERTKKATPEIIRDEANKAIKDATENYAKAKLTKDPDTIQAAKKDLASAKYELVKAEYKANKFKPDSAVYHAQKELDSAKRQLAEVKEDPKAFHAAEIIRQGGIDGKGGRIKRAENAYKDTKAKYLFTSGERGETARIDMNPDKQNVHNLLKTKGRIYFAMEGSIKNDAVLAAVKREDPTAAVVNVPSVTLWHNKSAGEGEIQWFARTHAKDRQVVLIPDADGVNNVNVMRQANALASTLKNHGAKQVLVAAPPVKYGTKNVIEPVRLPSGTFDERKGIDDHLGAGRGTLGQLAYQTDAKIPKFSLASYTRGEGNTEAKKLNRNALKNHEAMLGAISGLAGKKGAAQISANLLMQTSGITSKGSAIAARDKLADLGIIDVRYVFDKDVLAKNRKRVLIMPQKEVDEWVSKKIIKPLPEDLYAKDDYEASPIIVIKDPKYIVKEEDSHVGVLSDLPDWKPPKTYDGWRSPLTGKKDTTGIAANMVNNENKTKAKKASTPVAPVSTGTSKRVAKTAKQRLDQKKAPKGRRIVRTPAGAKKYGVPIGSVIPLSAEAITSTVLLSAIMSEEDIISFYNKCHDENGKFCEGDGGGKVKGKTVIESGVETGQWPPRSGRPVTKTYEFEYGPDSGAPRQIEDVGPVKKEYEVQALDGTTIHLLDKTGLVTDKQADDLLQVQARFHEMYHLEPPRHIIVADDEENYGAIASVKMGKSDVFTLVNQTQLGIPKTASGGSREWAMPSAYEGDTTLPDYDMAHEYGHQVDGDKNYDQASGLYYQNPMTFNPNFRNHLSAYALNNPDKISIEGYAEAFAEWHHTDGRTTNPAAIAMARYEGWNGNDAVPFETEATRTGRPSLYRGIPSSSRYDERPYYGPGFNILSMISFEGYAEDILDSDSEEFYNKCHDEDGKFCEGDDGPGRAKDKIVSGNFGSSVKTVAKARFGSVVVDGIKAKAVYELTDRKGNVQRLYDQTGDAGPYKDDLLWSHARMGEWYNLDPTRGIIVAKPGRDSQVESDSFATVYGDSPYTYINSEKLGLDVGKLSDGFQMPSAKTGDTKNMHYLMLHEYGHHVDFKRHSYHGAEYSPHPLTKDPNFMKYISRYGKSGENGVEAYAEAFAEWHHSGGSTKNPAAIAMARYEGWAGTEGFQASGQLVNGLIESSNRPIEYIGEVVHLTLQNAVQLAKENMDMAKDIPKSEKGIIIHDTFNEGGAIIEGDFEVVEPSEAEIARAKQIMDEVLKELGLENDGG